MRDLLNQELAFTPDLKGHTIDASVVVCGGMGGSALPALVLRFLGSAKHIIIHRDYDLPDHVPAGAAYVAISYSGNTEETLSFEHEEAASFAQKVSEKDLPLSVIASGGELLSFAQENNLSYVQLPSGMQPRDAVVSSVKALLALTNESHLFANAECDADKAEREAASLGTHLADSVPVFYSSTRNEALSYIAKIYCNETAKIPAFSNVFPEMNHNEMQGFDAELNTHGLTEPFFAVFLRDESDDERVQHRMDLTEQLLASRGVRTLRVDLPSEHRAETFLYTWWLMRAMARSLGAHYEVPLDEVPLIEAFKKEL